VAGGTVDMVMIGDRRGGRLEVALNAYTNGREQLESSNG
jgi:hypothetical protein